MSDETTSADCAFDRFRFSHNPTTSSTPFRTPESWCEARWNMPLKGNDIWTADEKGEEFHGHLHRGAPAMLTIFMMAISTTRTWIMLTSMSSPSATRIPRTALPKSGA
jgi:hypothetical protein